MGNQQSIKAKFVNLLKQVDENALAGELKSILLLDFSQEDYLNAFYPSDIRDILKQSPQRVKSIIYFLHQFLCDNQNDLESHVQFRQWKNTLRILTTIIPVLYEGQFKEQMKQILWNTKIPKQNEENQDKDPPLIISLLQRLFQLCFQFGFTIEAFEHHEQVLINDTLLQQFIKYYQTEWSSYKLQVGVIWKGFNTQCKYSNDIAKYFENRYLVLSCIFALVSSSLFEQELFMEREFSEEKDHQNQISSQKQLNNNQETDEQQFQVQNKQDNQIENQNNQQKQSKKHLVQIPNAALLVLSKLQFFPEFLVSIIAVSVFPTERIKQFLRGIINLHNQIEENLEDVSLKLTQLVLGGQGFVCKYVISQGEENEEMIKAEEHFHLYNISFPQFIDLPQQLLEGILIQLTQKFYTYYKSQQQFIRGTFERQLTNVENNFIILSYLSSKAQYNIPNLMVVFLLSFFNPKQYIQKICIKILKLLSVQPQSNKQLSENQEFTLTFAGAPICVGTWGDLLITSFCEKILKDLFSFKEEKLIELTQILFNVSSEIGKINIDSSKIICSLIKILANHNLILKSPNFLFSLQNLIGAVSQMIYFCPDDNIDLIQQVYKIKDSIKFFHELKISQKMLQAWWDKHGSKIQKQSNEKRQQQLSQQEEVQGLKQIEQVQSDGASQSSYEYDKYIQNWKSFNEETIIKFDPLISLVKLFENLHNLADHSKDEQQFKQIIQQHHVQSLMVKQNIFKITVNKFEIFKTLTKQIWFNCLRKSQTFPYFENSECPYFQKVQLEK